jgi:hypothetical protein
MTASDEAFEELYEHLNHIPTAWGQAKAAWDHQDAKLQRMEDALEAIHHAAAAGTPGETFRQFARRTASKALQTDSTLPP